MVGGGELCKWPPQNVMQKEQTRHENKNKTKKPPPALAQARLNQTCPGAISTIFLSSVSAKSAKSGVLSAKSCVYCGIPRYMDWWSDREKMRFWVRWGGYTMRRAYHSHRSPPYFAFTDTEVGEFKNLFSWQSYIQMLRHSVCNVIRCLFGLHDLAYQFAPTKLNYAHS